MPREIFYRNRKNSHLRLPGLSELATEESSTQEILQLTIRVLALH